MVALNSKIHKNKKLYKLFACRIQETKKALSLKQINFFHVAKRVMKRAWKTYNNGVAEYIKKNFTDKNYYETSFELQDYFKQCLQLSWLSARKELQTLNQTKLFV